MHHLYSTYLLSRNQFGFIPQSGTFSGIIEVKHIVNEQCCNDQSRHKGTVDVARWPNILFPLRFQMPKKPLKLCTKLCARLMMHTHSKQCHHRKTNEQRWPQVSVADPAYGTFSKIHY